ncbi:MAG: PA0069 family radical SAM protein [Acidobacteriota bacterium]
MTRHASAGLLRGRGAAENPANRFDRIEFVFDPEDPDRPAPKTEFYRDASRSLITRNESPDLGFHASINPYRGCEHGCVYCFARAYHEFLGFSAGLDFETKIMVKEDAPEILRRELSSPKWQPQMIMMSGVTDPYQPIERKLRVTRRCLEVLAEFRNPAAIITKNHLVERDVDVLSELARHNAVGVYFSITTLDADLAGVLEPRTSVPARRLQALSALAHAGIPCGVAVCPVIPGLADHEIPAIVAAAAAAGATSAAYAIVRLPQSVRAIFERWLARHRPAAKKKVLDRLREIRGEDLDEKRIGRRFTGEGELARQIRSLFAMSCRKVGLADSGPDLSASSFRRPTGQLGLFD